jgi:hypothetical protein
MLCVFVALCSITSQAQTDTADSVKSDTIPHKESLLKRMDDKLSARYYHSKYDTNYVVRPKEKWLLRLMANQAANYIHAKGTVNDVWSKYDLHTKRNTTFSFEVNYCDIAVSLSLNPAKISGSSNRDYEFNFEYHGNWLSFNLNYQRTNSWTGDIDLKDIHHMEEDALNMKVFSLTAYYTFNHRRFSFPAAFYQNYRQLRSAGSWLAGLAFQSGCIRTTDELKKRNPQAPEVHIDAAHVGIGGGYGYNLVLGKHSQWLLHLSILPTIVVYNHNELTVNDTQLSAKHMRFNMIFNERAAVVYHFSPRYFVGTTFIMDNTVFDDKAVVVNQNRWFARAFVGVRL